MLLAAWATSARTRDGSARFSADWLRHRLIYVCCDRAAALQFLRRDVLDVGRESPGVPAAVPEGPAAVAVELRDRLGYRRRARGEGAVTCRCDRSTARLCDGSTAVGAMVCPSGDQTSARQRDRTSTHRNRTGIIEVAPLNDREHVPNQHPGRTDERQSHRHASGR